MSRLLLLCCICRFSLKKKMSVTLLSITKKNRLSWDYLHKITSLGFQGDWRVDWLLLWWTSVGGSWGNLWPWGRGNRKFIRKQQSVEDLSEAFLFFKFSSFWHQLFLTLFSWSCLCFYCQYLWRNGCSS